MLKVKITYIADQMFFTQLAMKDLQVDSFKTNKMFK